MQSTWSDDDSNDSIDEEDLVGGLVVHNDGNSDVSDIDINDKKAFHESYKMMFAKWEEVYNENVTLKTQVSNLLDDKAKLESEKLDHILSLGKSSSDHHGLGYQYGKDSNSQGVFVKDSSQTASPPIVKLPYLQKGKVVAHSSPAHQENVTFADGVKSQVLGKGILNVEGFPKLDNVLHVEDLKENLLSISQICDQNLFVNFDRNKCRILDVDGNCILEGHRSSDYCYKLTSSIVCHKTTLDDTELWHQKLGHLNYKLLTRIVKTGALKGVPMLKKKQLGICGSCQYGKQQRALHKAIQDKATSNVLQLLHMDLMRPMQVESLAGKRYAFVCVDDFSSIAFRVYNMRTQNIVESANVVIDNYQDFADYSIEEEITNLLETPNFVTTTHEVRVIEKGQSSEPPLKEKELVEEDTSKETLEIVKEKVSKLQAIMDLQDPIRKEPSSRVKKNRPSELILGTKWIFKNKTDEFGNIVRNKDRLVAQGYTQIEGVDFDETFAPVARIESIRLLFAVACLIGLKLFQMDVKSAFLNGILNEEAYVEQLKGFEDPHFPNHVFKLKKALYGLKQTPRVWYERLTKYLLENSYKRGGVDKTLFIKQLNPGILVVQIYVDDIMFGYTSSDYMQEFVSQMKREFEMSMVGELTYFLGLQVKQMENGIFVNQSKYAKSLVKMFGLDSAKHLRTPMSTNAKLTVDDSGFSVDPSIYRSMIGYSDAYGAGNADDRKSIIRGCFYLGNNLVSWHSKKQNSISLSTAEAEYIAAGSCCTQLLWMKQMLVDYGMVEDTLTVFCDNTSAINISKNLVQYSRTKHIDIRHHFIRDLDENKAMYLEYIDTEKQLADIFTKALDSKRFESLKKALVMTVYLDSYLVIRSQVYADTMLNIGESSHANSNPKRHLTLTPYLCSGCGRPHEIHILNDDEDFGPKFGQIPPEESMHSSDSDSMESDPSEDSFHSGPSSFDPRITTNAAIVHAAITDHQPPPHAPSRVVASGAPPSTLRDLPTFVVASVRSSPPSASFLLILPILRPPF
ncbi:hypothetical protein KPL71_007985 [Citrus sinensis]|uniref:Uncharacterized protein n=1 Tax=Citrus sinensis TaxID=2711 RepID=A0ACB8M400_CITSI|nr:hypothetical protein KPL71_007985 [Citrus sinensis]